MAKKIFDVVIIGTGSAGFSAMEAAVSLGATVCVIEKTRLGGECPNFACVPSKAILKAAKVYRHAQKAKEFGIRISGLSFEFSEVMKYRARVVNAITGGGDVGDRYQNILKKNGVTFEHGSAEFVNKDSVIVNNKIIFGKAFVVATGTLDLIPAISGIDTVNYIGWKDAIAQKRQPKSIAIIGGGPVGCELATFYASFGTRVVLLQSAGVVLHREDEEISILAGKSLESIGVEVVTSARIERVMNSNTGVYGVKYKVGDLEKSVAVEQIVMATGKRSNTKGLELENAEVDLTDKGVIKTNKEQRTSQKNIFAGGDVDGGMQFTHTAHHEGYVAGYNAGLFALKKRATLKKIDERVVPRVTFIEPEVATVGMTGAQVKDAYGSVLVGRWKIGALGRAVTENEREGLLKIVAHPKTNKILGGHMISARAGEVIHEIALAIYLNASADKVAQMIHAFPTYSEAIGGALSSMTKE